MANYTTGAQRHNARLICEHGTETIYRCPVNAEHDEAADGLSGTPGFCTVDDCGEELEAI